MRDRQIGEEAAERQAAQQRAKQELEQRAAQADVQQADPGGPAPERRSFRVCCQVLILRHPAVFPADGVRPMGERSKPVFAGRR